MPEPRQGGNASYVAQLLQAAGGYYLAGLVGLALVDPLGVSSVLWPAMGVAIVAVLAYGYRVWPGLFVSSFLVAAYPPTWLYSPGGLPVAAALGIGVANVAQALIAVVLIRRVVGWPNPLFRGRDVVAFLAFCGPVSAVIGSTITIWWLHRTGIVGADQRAFAWWGWWVGNTLGAVLVVPLLLVPFGRPRAMWRDRGRAFTLPFLLSIILVTTLLVATARWERARALLEFERRADMLGEAIERNLTHYLDVLYSMESYVRTLDGSLDGTRFRQFARERLARYDGIQAIGWNVPVTDFERDPFEQSMRESEHSDYRITERDADGRMTPAARRSDYVVVKFIEPLEGNRNALGYDLLSDPVRRQAFVTARDAGALTLTAPIRLVQETGEQSGTLAVLPLFDGLGRNVEGRRASLRGFVVGVLRLGDLLDASIASLPNPGLNVRLLDATDSTGVQSLAFGCIEPQEPVCGKPGSPVAVPPRGFDWHRDIDVGGRRWVVEVSPTADYFSRTRQWSAWLAPGGSVILAVVTAAFLLMLSGRVVLDARRQRQLEAKNTELERFTYSVSHDLKSPLITIKGFADCLAQDLNRDERDDARRDLERIDTAANSMMQTLDGLLLLSRAGRFVDVQHRVDMQAVVRDALARVAARLENVQVRTAPALPPAAGDPVRLAEVFQNLLENAAKFMGDQPTPRIEIGACLIDEQQAYFVRDNGRGMAEDDTGRVFDAFVRLDPGIAGTGLGLATARRVVELHGGRIWLESAGPGKGCTVFLTLPRPDTPLTEMA